MGIWTVLIFGSGMRLFLVAFLTRIQEISFILVTVSVNETQRISLWLAILYVNTKWKALQRCPVYTMLSQQNQLSTGRLSVCLHVIRAFLLQKLPGSIYICCFPCDLEPEYLLGPRGWDTGISVYIKCRVVALQDLLSHRFVLSKFTCLSQPCLLLDSLQVDFFSLLHFFLYFMADFSVKELAILCAHWKSVCKDGHKPEQQYGE